MAVSPVLTQPKVLIGATVIVVLATSGYFTLAAFLGLPPFARTPDVRSNFQVVLDRSSGMEDPFDNGTTTKLGAAIQAINEEVLPVQVADTDFLALRQYGGPCQGHNSRQIVGFDRHNKDNVRDSLGNITIDGTSTFADGVAAAIEDVNDPSRFRNAFNSILVFTGSGDACDPGSAPTIINEQLKKMEDQGIYVNLTFIGLDIPADQLGFVGARFIDVGSLPQLRSELNQLMAELQEGRDKWLEASESEKVAILESMSTLALGEPPTVRPTHEATPTATPGGTDNRTPIPPFVLVLPEFVAPGQVVNLSAGVSASAAGGGGPAAGQPPYTYSILENNSGASINSATGEYTAGPTTGATDIVAVTDTTGEVVQAELNVVEGPDIQLPQPLVASGSSLTIGATGGLLPYIYSIPENNNNSGASIDPDTGVYTAGPTTEVTDTVVVTDARGIPTSALVEVVESPAISVPQHFLTPGTVQIIEATGGLPPYTYSISDNKSGASLDPDTGEYTAGATTGVTDTVTVTDARDIPTSALVEVVEPPLIVLPRRYSSPNTVQIVEVTGGLPPYAYSISDNQSGASIDPDSGEYTAGATTGVTDTLAVTDANGIETMALLEVVEPPLIVLQRPFLTSDSGQIIEAIAGQPPYTFSITENNSGGSIDPDTGEYQAGTNAGVTDIVEVTDARGISTQASVAVLDRSDDDRSDREANLNLIKEVNNATPHEGDLITFTLTLSNEGPRGAAGILVTDILPAGVTFVSADPSYDVQTGQWTVGTLASGGSAILAIDVTVNDDNCANTITNSAQITAANRSDPVPQNNSDSVGFAVQCADLALSQEINIATPNEGDPITFTVTLNNIGPDTATGILVTDILPAGVTFVSADPSYDVQTGTWTVGTLASGGSAILAIDVTVNSDTCANTITNSAQIGAADQADPEPQNNSDSLEFTVQCADLALSQEIDIAIPNEGDPITFTVTLNNIGPDAATGILVTDILPAGVTFVSADPSYDVQTGTWSVGTLASGGSAILAIDVTVNSGTGGSTITNTAQVTALNQTDPNNENNRANATIMVGEQTADLTVQITSGPSVSCSGTPAQCFVTVDIEVTNLGNGDVTDPFDILIVAEEAPDTTMTVTNGLSAGTSASFELASVLVGSCFDPDCTATVEVDSGDVISESDETNNADTVTRVG